MDDRARSVLSGASMSADFTLEDIPLNLPHIDNSPRALELDATFRVLSQAGLTSSTISTLFEISHIPKSTL
jgi:hypothetical protein